LIDLMIDRIDPLRHWTGAFGKEVKKGGNH
jgi:hypothetical protein